MSFLNVTFRVEVFIIAMVLFIFIHLSEFLVLVMRGDSQLNLWYYIDYNQSDWKIKLLVAC